MASNQNTTNKTVICPHCGREVPPVKRCPHCGQILPKPEKMNGKKYKLTPVEIFLLVLGGIMLSVALVAL
ncbi:hypothetical protein ACFSKU_07905 [Pontibacter silvestris]|uniref:Zinc-ribbon domain-containing protein n=1 Tax=Pontibacter silvestris TaxID=2305183 RepID=A0ABW4WY55_9BACT|nr:hypothetical protein [Pontibacter silvestris]MCC9138513.1 hypothetical protein [Pontibacter silvestris]